MKRFFPLGLGLLCGCEPMPPLDTTPPLLIRAGTPDEQTLSLEFDEPLASGEADGDFASQAPKATVKEKSLVVPLPKGLKPGKPYQWSAEAKDKAGNLSTVAGRFFGSNPHPARLLINEVRVAGSGSHTDAVEFLVVQDGSLGGVTLEYWSSPDSVQAKVFPDTSVAAGQFVVLHFKPNGVPEEVDEVEDSRGSSGSDTRPEAWDFWQEEGKGLSAVTGLFVLRMRPEAPSVEVFPWTTKPGEGLKILAASGFERLWSGAELNPAGCTATRTWNRGPAPDLDRSDSPLSSEAENWMIVNTSCSTIGGPNNLTIWPGRSAKP